MIHERAGWLTRPDHPERGFCNRSMKVSADVSGLSGRPAASHAASGVAILSPMLLKISEKTAFRVLYAPLQTSVAGRLRCKSWTTGISLSLFHSYWRMVTSVLFREPDGACRLGHSNVQQQQQQQETARTLSVHFQLQVGKPRLHTTIHFSFFPF